MKELTERQAEILTFIRQHIDALGYAPSLKEVSQEFGLSLATVVEHLEGLERKDAIHRTNGVARSIVIVE